MLQSTNSNLQPHEALLARLPRYLANAWNLVDARKSYFGDGSSEENGIRTNSNVAFALASWIRQQPDPGSSSLIEERERVSHVIYYLCDSHRTGSSACAWGGTWGLEWQSAWWAAKLGLAALLLGELAGKEVQDQVTRVVTAEADHQLTRHAPTGLFLDTKAEETAWDCEALAVALALAPGHSNARRWSDKLVEFSFNVLSVPQDRTSTEVVSGHRVSEAVYTCNLHGDFSLENHGSYHFCYVASPLLSKAYCFLALKMAGLNVPQALQHHVDDVWQLARNTFLTHRFAYIGGQDWARYTYGEYFIVPALAYLDAALVDPEIRRIQQARIAVLAAEAEDNNDGSFYGKRFTGGQFSGQMGKYETDTFACIALTLALERFAERAPGPMARVQMPPVDSEFVHVSPEGQFCFWRTQDMFFSFAWSHLGHDIPSLVFGPRDRDDMLEWHAGNGIGRVRPAAEGAVIGVRTMRRMDHLIEISSRTVTRNRRGKPLYETRMSLVFDRSQRTVRVVHNVDSVNRLWLVRITGLTFRIPNDRFNAFRRTVSFNGRTLTFQSRRAEIDAKAASRPLWHRVPKLRRILIKLGMLDQKVRFESSVVEVDGAISLESNHPDIVLRRFGYPAGPGNSLWMEEFQSPGAFWRVNVKKGESLLSTSTALRLLAPPA